jgi:hypothetical protein
MWRQPRPPRRTSLTWTKSSATGSGCRSWVEGGPARLSRRFRKNTIHGSKEASIVNTWVFGGKNELIIAAQNIKGNTIHTKNLLASMHPPSRPVRKVAHHRGTYIGRLVGQAPKDEAEHFIRCPACNDWIDCRDLGHVLEHEGPLPHPAQDRPQ